MIERAHRTLKTVLAILAQDHPNTWPDHVPEAEKALNEAVHTSLGTSPYFAFFGRHPNREVGQLQLPQDEENMDERSLNIKELLKETMNRTTQRYRDTANAKRQNTVLEEGSYVWVYQEEPIPNTATKLNRKWKGPYKIEQVLGDGRAY